MTPAAPALLLDTCAIINLSYCSPVATLFKTRYAGRAGWTRAVRAELTRQRSRKPPHPQAGRANNWAASWLPSPIEIVDSVDQIAIARIQEQIALGSEDDGLDHLGEAASIHLLATAATGRLIAMTMALARSPETSTRCVRLRLSVFLPSYSPGVRSRPRPPICTSTSYGPRGA